MLICFSFRYQSFICCHRQARLQTPIRIQRDPGNPTLYAKKLQQSKKTKRYLHPRLTRLVIAITTQSWKQSTLVINSADLVVLIRHDMVLHPSKFSSLLHKSNSSRGPDSYLFLP